MTKNIFGGALAPLFFTFFLSNCVAADKIAPAVEAKKDVQPEVVEVVKFEVTQEVLDKGRRLYISNCISCHNKDPNKKGALGPELIDSPLEVVTAKVMTGVYPETLPEGFVPKRKTKIMKKITKLKDDIPAIHAWIQSMKPQASAD